MPGFIYILQDEKGRYYIGSTNDPDRRMEQHKQGHTWTTQRFKNFKLAFSQAYPTLAEARRIELKLKRLKRRDYITKIIKDGYVKLKL